MGPIDEDGAVLGWIASEAGMQADLHSSSLVALSIGEVWPWSRADRNELDLRPLIDSGSARSSESGAVGARDSLV